MKILNIIENVFLSMVFIGFGISILYVNYIHSVYLAGIIIMCIGGSGVYIIDNIKEGNK